MKSILLPNIKAVYTLTLSRPTKHMHMAKNDQVCFHKRLFANPVKPQRCTTESMRPLHGINKDIGSAKLATANDLLWIVTVSVPY